MSNKTDFRLRVSPLTGTVYAGRVKQLDETTAVSTGTRYDVTNDFLEAVITYGESHGGAFEIVGGGEAYDVTVTKRAAQAAGDQP